MTTENAIRVLAGTLVLTSVALAHFVSPWWLLLACFVGLNLIQSAFTGFCPAEMILKRLRLTEGNCCAPPEKKA
ncbi:MAG TPA: DUF2892 domain-containing protein [Verrucomicrobiota bacterium]|nr:DUF2892 domain-containing protein [Verrucomicrobiales bacterium]HRI13514.1 DUF2892 domain-containing protein [Verrucomicrobiota bacterium]